MAAKEKPQRTARLTHAKRLLWILKGEKIDLYIIDDARPDPQVADPAFRLTKSDGTQYTVALTKSGPTCCCQDANYRHRTCKHAKALRAVGLLSADQYNEKSQEDS